jgi:hypothetical protein
MVQAESGGEATDAGARDHDRHVVAPSAAAPTNGTVL